MNTTQHHRCGARQRPSLILYALVVIISMSFANPTPLAASTQLLPLTTRDTLIVNSTGAPVHLRGVNLGSWLLIELWMTDIGPRNHDLSCDMHVRQILTRRFGPSRARQLLQTYQHNFITSFDFDLIARMGMNCVRIPFYYEILEHDDHPYTYLPDGWRLLDMAISNCAARNLYCILDLHGAPGGQSADHTTGQTDRNRLFFDPAFQNRTIALWTAIAARYANQPAIAAYDLLNEPWGAPTPDALISLYDRIYRAIRTVDPHRIIILEDRGPSASLDELPPPHTKNWHHIVYSFHPYLFDKHDYPSHRAFVDERLRTYTAFAATRQTPILIGEFHPQGGDQSWRYYLSTFNSRGVHWTLWSYKCSANMGDWGIVTTSVAPNLKSDSFEELLSAFARYATRPSDINTNLVALITECNTINPVFTNQAPRTATD